MTAQTDTMEKLVEAVAMLAYKLQHAGEGVLLNENKLTQDAWKSLTTTHFAAIDAAGWQLMPKVPTEDMWNAINSAWGAEECWANLLAAAPKVVP